jgi:hypothetical protein
MGHGVIRTKSVRTLPTFLEDKWRNPSNLILSIGGISPVLVDQTSRPDELIKPAPHSATVDPEGDAQDTRLFRARHRRQI